MRKLALSFCLAFLLPVSAHAAPKAPVSNGIEIKSIRPTAGGHMLDLRYRVVDPIKAATVINRKSRPYVIVSKTGAKLAVPAPQLLGPLQQTTQKLLPKKTYFVFFVNPGRQVKSGDRLTVVFGKTKFKNVKVQ